MSPVLKRGKGMEQMDFSYLDRNYKDIRSRMDAAEKAAGRTSPVTLIAAAKSGTAEEIDYLHHHCGLCDIGENRVQQLLEHYEKIDRVGLNFHFIGHLQTNKVKYIIDKVTMIHSVDSEHLAAEIDRQAEKHGRIMKVLVEVNSGREENKSGVLPEDAASLCGAIGKYPHLKLSGLMTMAPVCENPEDFCNYFREISRIAVDIFGENMDNKKYMLSMGMSGSFEQAIACGATAIRVGRKLFEK